MKRWIIDYKSFNCFAKPVIWTFHVNIAMVILLLEGHDSTYLNLHTSERFTSEELRLKSNAKWFTTTFDLCQFQSGYCRVRIKNFPKERIFLNHSIMKSKDDIRSNMVQTSFDIYNNSVLFYQWRGDNLLYATNENHSILYHMLDPMIQRGW